MHQLHSIQLRTNAAVTFIALPNNTFLQQRPESTSKCLLLTRTKVRHARTVMPSSDPPNGRESSLSEAQSSTSRQRAIPINGPFSQVASGTVTFMAIADEFDMPSLSRRLLTCKTEYGGTETTPHGPVLRLIKPSSKGGANADAFVFPYGCVVVWGTQVDTDDFLSLIIEDALEPRAKPAADSMEYTYGTYGSVKRDVITLESSVPESSNSAPQKSSSRDRLDPSLERLAISWGLAQSVKLGAFESATRATIENTRHLPEELAYSGQITASRREVSRLMGRLFLDRYRFHLSGDLLMTPAFFWEHERYLPCYRRMERYLEVRERGEVLNKRVEVLQELYQLLGEELGHQNSMALELAITVMIAFEILLTLLTLAKESVRSVFSACALFFCLIALGWTLWRLYRRRRFSKSVSRFPRAPNGMYR